MDEKERTKSERKYSRKGEKVSRRERDRDWEQWGRRRWWWMDISGNRRWMMKGRRNRERQRIMGWMRERRKEKQQGSKDDSSVFNTQAQQHTFRGQTHRNIKSQAKYRGRWRITPLLKLFAWCNRCCSPTGSPSSVKPPREHTLLGVRWSPCSFVSL